jgi:hypothetical protein
LQLGGDGRRESGGVGVESERDGRESGK